MPKFKPADTTQSRFIPVIFADQIQPGTLEYAIDWVIENRVKADIFHVLYNNDETGARAYDPRALLKIVILGYSRGLVSSRKIADACRTNVVFMAISGNQTPDFTTIAWFVRSIGDQAKRIFAEVLLVCSELGLLGGTEFALDGCKISSNASKEWSGTFKELERKKEKIDQTVKYLLKKHRKADRAESPDIGKKGEVQEKIDLLKSKSEKIGDFLKAREPKMGARGREVQSNITDNESAKMKTSHGVIQGYNGMALVDDKRQVIVQAEVFGTGQEHALLKPMLEAAKAVTNKIGLGPKYFQGKRFIADTASFEESNLKYLHGENIDAYIPDPHFRKRDPRFEGAAKYHPPKYFTQADFKYDSKNDSFTCPSGQTLKHGRKKMVGVFSGIDYVSSKSKCAGCKFRPRCLKSEKQPFRRLFVTKTVQGRNHSAEMKAKIDTPYAREVYSRRMGIVEPVFGNISAAKGMDRFTLRGKAKVNIQWICFTLVHNLGKIAGTFGSAAG